LFQTFSQADNSTTRRFGGSGLGLAISKRLANLMDGDISVVSEPAAGSVFTLAICTEVESSIGESQEGVFAIASSARDNRNATSRSALCGRVLLAEDSRDIRRFISTILTDAGAEVVTAQNGRQAVDLAIVQPFDLILMDVQMPILDGYAAASEILAKNPSIPIIALTANAMAHDRTTARDSGCVDYLTKPIEPDRLLASLAKYLAPHASTDQPSTVKHRSELPQSAMNEQLLREYLQELPDDVARLVASVIREDFTDVKGRLHQLKGSGGLYGFPDITRLAGEAEQAIIDGRLDRGRSLIDDLVEYSRNIEGFEVPSAAQSDNRS